MGECLCSYFSGGLRTPHSQKCPELPYGKEGRWSDLTNGETRTWRIRAGLWVRLSLAKSLFAQGGPGLLNPVQERAQSLPGRARVGSRMARSLLPQNLPLWAGELSLCITRERAGVKLNPSSPANADDCRCFRFRTVWVSILSSFFMLPFHKPYHKPFINPYQRVGTLGRELPGAQIYLKFCISWFSSS